MDVLVGVHSEDHLLRRAREPLRGQRRLGHAGDAVTRLPWTGVTQTGKPNGRQRGARGLIQDFREIGHEAVAVVTLGVRRLAATSRTRFRSNGKPARPAICLLIDFRSVTRPSTMPELERTGQALDDGVEVVAEVAREAADHRKLGVLGSVDPAGQSIGAVQPVHDLGELPDVSGGVGQLRAAVRELLEAKGFFTGQAVGVTGEPGGGLAHGRCLGQPVQRRVGSAQGFQPAAHAAGAAEIAELAQFAVQPSAVGAALVPPLVEIGGVAGEAMAAAPRSVADDVVGGVGLGVAAYGLAVQAELGGGAVDTDTLVVKGMDFGVPAPSLCGLHSLRSGGLGRCEPGFVRRIQAAAVCADGLLDGVAEVPPDMPPICDLDSVRGRGGGGRGIRPGTVSADRLDALASGEPAGEGVRFPVFQQVNGCAGLAVHQHAAVHVRAFEGEIAHAEHPRCRRGSVRRQHDQAQDGGPAPRRGQQRREPRARQARQRDADRREQTVKKGRAPLVPPRQPFGLFGERHPLATRVVTEQAPDHQGDHDHAPANRTVGHRALVSAVSPSRSGPAVWTRQRRLAASARRDA
ncbi:hypothetical protein C9F11_45795 (plasmid) [Streptomyces sp. YIM 121038]|nr:hypothetical protein C9F11_45795 [Streptomyces sp. YIM 121038]